MHAPVRLQSCRAKRGIRPPVPLSRGCPPPPIRNIMILYQLVGSIWILRRHPEAPQLPLRLPRPLPRQTFCFHSNGCALFRIKESPHLPNQRYGMAAAAPDQFRVIHCFSALVKRSTAQVKGFSEAPEYKSCTRITKISDSSEVTPSNWSRLALNRKKLKGHVRGGVLPNVRKDLWLGVLGVSDADSVLLAKAFGEPDDGELLVHVRPCHLCDNWCHPLTCSPQLSKLPVECLSTLDFHLISTTLHHSM